MTRKLATLRAVTEIIPIEGADNIELARIDGWQCVVKKGEFQVGNVGVYFEIDSFLDHTRPEFAFLAPRAIKWDGKEGARIKTMKLRGALSQGLLLPLSTFASSTAHTLASPMGQAFDEYVTELLSTETETLESLNEILDLDASFDVDKWEKKLSANLAGTARGNFPCFIPKTDQERIQNIPSVFKLRATDEFQVTQKLDGSSMTVYLVNTDSKWIDLFKTLGEDSVPEYGVCSRNLDLVDTEGNAFWSAFHREGMLEKLQTLLKITARPAIAVQGELVGKGIQDNHEKVEGEDEFYVYDIFDIDAQQYMNPFVAKGLVDEVGFNHVPVIHESIKLIDYASSVDELLLNVVGPSIRQPIGEGKVFKLLSNTDGFSFKGISNHYLLKKGG